MTKPYRGLGYSGPPAYVCCVSRQSHLYHSFSVIFCTVSTLTVALPTHAPLKVPCCLYTPCRDPPPPSSMSHRVLLPSCTTASAPEPPQQRPSMDALPAAWTCAYTACQPPWLLRDLSGVAYRHRPGRSRLEAFTPCLSPSCAAPLALPLSSLPPPARRPILCACSFHRPCRPARSLSRCPLPIPSPSFWTFSLDCTGLARTWSQPIPGQWPPARCFVHPAALSLAGTHRCQHCTPEGVKAVGALAASASPPEGSSTSVSGRQPAGRTTQRNSTHAAASTATGSSIHRRRQHTTVAAGGSTPSPPSPPPPHSSSSS
jgi:hypothetical protein